MMKRQTENRIVLIVRKTRMEGLMRRFNTAAQAKFYLTRMGSDFSDYEREDETYSAEQREAKAILEEFGRLEVLQREYLPNYVFGADDTIVAMGQDGLVANTMKYLDGQPVIGVNPDPKRWDGVLAPFSVRDLKRIVPEVFARQRKTKSVTMARAELSDGQSLHGVNDLFIGVKTHVSARYEIESAGKREEQSSSGVIVSTGLGSTGWLKSILTGAAGIGARMEGGRAAARPEEIKPMEWDAPRLIFSVREPFLSRSTGASVIFGDITTDRPLKVVSKMGENGVIFSDGIESDFIQFNAGTQATIRIAEKRGNLIV